MTLYEYLRGLRDDVPAWLDQSSRHPMRPGLFKLALSDFHHINVHKFHLSKVLILRTHARRCHVVLENLVPQFLRPDPCPRIAKSNHLLPCLGR